ncbi:G protein-activated inward rectifier potassium channel 3 isoform X2 [Denticeps clupeoides]|uniref:G protein-activated inward rectifier potassium channel 3 isoform X2 n=1 Tax=Denticeps clupeoides TaxID=299321 RepID=UPI0010A2E507|nr:G protein-activated inward rectifier potassium channel 3-like isoform X2 [Denticeps clupeoides]
MQPTRTRGASVPDARWASGYVQDQQSGRRASANNTNLWPRSVMVSQSRPNDGVRYQTHLVNVEVEDKCSEPAARSLLPLPDITPDEFNRPGIRRHKSTTDLPHSPQRGTLRTQRPTEADLALLHRCSLREPNGLPCWCPRHALSVPNMTCSGSPRRSISGLPSHSTASSPVHDLVQSAKARSKLLETEAAQTPTCPPEAREQLRYVSKDGKCRVGLSHIPEASRFLSDMFTSFVDLQYRWFLFIFMLCYAVTWLFFAVLYFLNALLRGDLEVIHEKEMDTRVPAALGHEAPCYPNVDGFVSALLFSVETQRTIGYGARTVSAACHEGVLLVMMQCIVGSMIDALMVGCMFVKISRPKKRAETLLFSRTCTVANRDDQLCLMFRLGDLRESHMVDAKVRAKLIKSRQTTEGEFLPLEHSEVNLGYESGSDRLFLVEPQVIQHAIDSTSPFWEMGPEQLRKQQFEIIVILEGIVEATGTVRVQAG